MISKNKYMYMYMIVLVILFLTFQLCIAAQGNPTQYVEPTLDPNYPKPGDKALVEKTVNGITVRIIHLKKANEKILCWSEEKQDNVLTDKQVITVDACYSTPDSGEWLLYGEIDMLQFGDIKSSNWYGSDNWWNERIPDGTSMGEKCSRYQFNFDVDVKIEPPLTITFDRMFATPREGLSPCDELIKRVETNPRAQEAGLRIRCEDVPNARDDFTLSVHDATPVLADFDKSVLTRQEAHALMLEIQDATVYGPWIFRIHPTN